jgi:ribulose 1,5-bisphosphate synthetase/thiazole synthase
LDAIKHNKEITVTAEKYDVIVAGGGISGISAALAAARNGAKVLLVEKQCLLGGLATLGLITIYLPLCDGEGNQVIYGIGEELLRLSVKYGVEARYPKAWLENGSVEEKKNQRFMVQYNPHIFAIAVEQLLKSEGVEFLYDTRICDVEMQEKRIKTVIVENIEGRSAIMTKSVVDATGDAAICQFSGAKTEIYKENKLANWYYLIHNGKLQLKPLGVLDLDDGVERLPDISENRYSGLNAKENTEMIILGHSKMLEDILEMRINEKDDTIVPATMPTIPQLRMTRRLVGAYELDDSEMHKIFMDSVGMTGDWRIRGPVYQIPFRCLYGNEVENLITAGRCISVTTGMWDISRVIPTCAVTGEAAGTAAALTDDFSELDIAILQAHLLQQGVKLSL